MDERGLGWVYRHGMTTDARPEYRLADQMAAQSARVAMSGVQAIVRVLLDLVGARRGDERGQDADRGDDCEGESDR